MKLHCLFSAFIFCLLSLPANAQTKPSIQLATTYHEGIAIEDYWVSEKLDGVRAYWNGKQLVTRNGNPINPPHWFIRQLPPRHLEGELWQQRSHFNTTSGIVRRKLADNKDWRSMKFMLFDLPHYQGTFTQRLTELTNIVKQIDQSHVQVIGQFKLKSADELMTELDRIVALGGEGLMLHHQDAPYKTGRQHHLLKLKQYQDAEAVVLEHLRGKGKFSDVMGAIRVKNSQGVVFKVGSGFTLNERKNPPAIGSTITYKYFGVSKNNVPRFPSFMRIRKDE